jgi:hypothetical protein
MPAQPPTKLASRNRNKNFGASLPGKLHKIQPDRWWEVFRRTTSPSRTTLFHFVLPVYGALFGLVANGAAKATKHRELFLSVAL